MIFLRNSSLPVWLEILQKFGTSWAEIPARLTISNTNKKVTDVMKEKLNPRFDEI